MAKKTWRAVALYGALIALAILFLTPYYVLLRNALMTQLEVLGGQWKWLPIPPRFESFRTITEGGLIATGLKNSLLVALYGTVGQIVLASWAGYGLARIPYRWSNQILALILFPMMIPAMVSFIPLFILISSLGWVNTYQGLVVPTLFNMFAAFMFRQFYLDFPIEIEEAGKIDGLGHWGIYWQLLVPNSLGVMAALGLLTFVNTWNSFLWPLLVGSTRESWTVQIVLSTFLTAQTMDIPALFMGAVVGVLPLVLVFLFLQRFIVEGVRMSGIKG